MQGLHANRGVTGGVLPLVQGRVFDEAVEGGAVGFQVLAFGPGSEAGTHDVVEGDVLVLGDGALLFCFDQFAGDVGGFVACLLGRGAGDADRRGFGRRGFGTVAAGGEREQGYECEAFCDGH